MRPLPTATGPVRREQFARSRGLWFWLTVFGWERPVQARQR